ALEARAAWTQTKTASQLAPKAQKGFAMAIGCRTSIKLHHPKRAFRNAGTSARIFVNPSVDNCIGLIIQCVVLRDQIIDPFGKRRHSLFLGRRCHCSSSPRGWRVKVEFGG